MTFAQAQLRQLKRQLDRRSIKHRESNGMTLSYIEGWYAIAEANRIFGLDGRTARRYEPMRMGETAGHEIWCRLSDAGAHHCPSW